MRTILRPLAVLPVRLMEANDSLVHLVTIGGVGAGVLTLCFGPRALRHWRRTANLGVPLGRMAGGGVLIMVAPFAYEWLARAATDHIKLRSLETPNPA